MARIHCFRFQDVQVRAEQSRHAWPELLFNRYVSCILWCRSSLTHEKAPKDGPILGPPLGVSMSQPHRCFALRFLDFLDPFYNAEQPICCYDDCDPLLLDTASELPAASVPRGAAGPARRHQLGAQDAAIDVCLYDFLFDFVTHNISLMRRLLNSSEPWRTPSPSLLPLTLPALLAVLW